jgi:L-fuculose-phosphate aldolase
VEDPEARQLLGPRVVLVGYAPSGTGWLAAKLARALHPHVNAYLMRNHGVLCCGPDAEATTRTVAALESFSAARLRCLIEARAARDPAVRPALDRILAAFGRTP